VSADLLAVWLPRDVVRVAGPDAERFLQGQLSQDVAAVPAGGSAWSLLLQPQGKVDALVRVSRPAHGADELLVDTEGGWGAKVVERLERFKLRVKVVLEPLDWRCLALRGAGAHEVAVPAGAVALAADWPGLPGVDLLGTDLVVPSGLTLGEAATYHALRVAAGVPAMGSELDERTIPAEAGVVDMAVSFTKGCYTGQELVARIDSRGGNVPRRLRRVVVAGGPAPPPGATVHTDEGRQVGALTSVAATGQGTVALAYVQRAVEPPAEVELRWEGGTAPARVEALTPGR